MAQKKFSDYKLGDLVNWYEYAASGEAVVNGGTGIVVELRATNIKVYCTKKQLTKWFSIRNVDLIKKA